MNISKKTRGAVSVFLVMILVPCIVITSIFVDIGRAHMSKSMANSSADLALNSLMTNYDADLSEWYGLVASCQNIQEFYDVSAEYFLRTLSSQGLSEDEIYLLSDYYANATNDDTIYDLLQMECLTAKGDIVKGVTGANLSNATLIKDQVVEFMKYRAPIEITVSLIDRLKKDSSINGAAEAEENSPLVESKTEFYEAEGELLAAAFNSYWAIRYYFNEATANGITNEKLTEYANKINSYKNVYFDIHKLMITNLYNTGGLPRYSRVAYPIDNYKNSYPYTSGEVYSRKETVDGTDHYYIDGSKITSLLDSLETEIKEFKDAKTNFGQAASSLMGALPGSGDNDSNVIQWWVQMNNAVNSSTDVNHTTNMTTAGQELLKAYSKALAIKECELGNDIPENWETRLNELAAEVVALQDKYLKAGVTDDSDAYLKAVKKLEEISAANFGNLSSANLYVTVDNQTMSIDQAIPHIKTSLSAIRGSLKGCVDLLDIAIDGNMDDDEVPEKDRVRSLDELLTLANKYNSTLNTWSNTADNTLTQMGTDDQKEIADIKQVSQEINEESVRTLKTRLKNIRSQLKTFVSLIDEITYGLRTVITISDYSSFKQAADSKVSVSGIKLKNSELHSYAESTFSELFLPEGSPIFTLEHTSDPNYNPVINPETGQVNTPGLYVYLHDKFKKPTKEEVQDKQDELDGGKDEGNKAQEAAKDKPRYSGEGSEIKKEFSGDKTFSLADGAFSGIIDLFNSLINLDITNIRDDLYVTSYIMNMFSYATYENEALYSLFEDPTTLTLDNYTTEYQKSTIQGSEKTPKTWLSTDPKDAFNKTLTNKMINKSNNAAYGAEVEYILYGGRENKGNADNVKSVYSNIYGIRYALNLVSGFQHFWGMGNPTGKAINAVAGTIQGITCGVIPAQLTKVILIPILTIFETSKDLDRLQAGFPVELYKSDSSDWWIKVPDDESFKEVSQLTNIFKGSFDGPNTDKGIFYSDYLTVFVYLGLKSSAAEDMYQRMAEVIQTNIGNKIKGNSGDENEKEKDSGYSLSKSQVYFKVDATIRVKPLMITMPIFNDYQNNMNTKTDWCTYTIKTVRGYS